MLDKWNQELFEMIGRCKNQGSRAAALPEPRAWYMENGVIVSKPLESKAASSVALMDLFGVTVDDTDPSPHHVKNRGRSLHSRFISSSLFCSSPVATGIDFRLLLIQNMIEHAINTIARRLNPDPRELKLFTSNVQNFKLWTDLIASRYKGKIGKAHRKIGYSVGMPFRDRQEFIAKQSL